MIAEQLIKILNTSPGAEVLTGNGRYETEIKATQKKNSNDIIFYIDYGDYTDKGENNE